MLHSLTPKPKKTTKVNDLRGLIFASSAIRRMFRGKVQGKSSPAVWGEVPLKQRASPIAHLLLSKLGEQRIRDMIFDCYAGSINNFRKAVEFYDSKDNPGQDFSILWNLRDGSVIIYRGVVNSKQEALCFIDAGETFAQKYPYDPAIEIMYRQWVADQQAEENAKAKAKKDKADEKKAAKARPIIPPSAVNPIITTTGPAPVPLSAPVDPVNVSKLDFGTAPADQVMSEPVNAKPIQQVESDTSKPSEGPKQLTLEDRFTRLEEFMYQYMSGVKK